MEVLIKPATVTRILLAMIAVLTCTHLAAQYSIFYWGDPHLYGLVPLFNLDAEANLPSLYAFTTLFSCAVLLALIGAAAYRKPAGHALQWFGLALVFLFLSVDEALYLHERIMFPVRNMLNVSGWLYFSWVIPYGIALAIIAALYIGFLRDLPAVTRRYFIFAGIVFTAGALGMELVGGREFERHGSDLNVTYAAMTTIEELLEMLGIAIFIKGLLTHIANELPTLRIGVGAGVAAAATTTPATTVTATAGAPVAAAYFSAPNP